MSLKHCSAAENDAIDRLTHEAITDPDKTDVWSLICAVERMDQMIEQRDELIDSLAEQIRELKRVRDSR